MNDLKFSIIIPVKNGAATIERLFGSLLIQKNWIHEVLVCNDHSTDNTVDIANTYKALLPIKILTVPDECGNNPGSARQCGLDNATGDWVVFCDADDILAFCALDYYAQVVENNPDVKLICAALDEIRLDPFIMLEHIQYPVAWVHAKAFNLGYLRDHDIRCHPTLYTHEDKYLSLMTIFDIRASGLEESALFYNDCTTYYWVRSEGTMVEIDGGRYPILSLVDSMFAMIEPCAIMADRYQLSKEDVCSFFGDNLLRSIIDCYSKVQGAMFKWGEEVLDKYNVLPEAAEQISRIKRLTGWTNQSIIDLIAANPAQYNDGKWDTVRTIGEFVHSQTIYEFLNEVCPDGKLVTE